MTRLVVLAALAAAPLAALPAADDLTPDQQQEIIRKFAAKEAAFAQARENYTYRQRYLIETLGPGGRPDGKHEEVSDIVFTPDGQRTERTVYAPMDTLERIQMDEQDVQDMRNIQPFVLTTKDVDKYEIHYLGRDQVDEITCYLFAVKPKRMEEGQRYFAGQIWVDDRDLQIVKTYGRGVGLQKKNSDHKWPKFETYREQIDGKYWFPTYTISNDVLNFRNESVPIKMLITYKDYKQFKSTSTITYEDVGGDSNKKEQAPPKP